MSSSWKLRAALALALCACPPSTRPGPDASTPDASVPDASVAVTADAGPSFVIGPIATPLRARTELDRTIETTLVSLGGRAVVVSSGATPGCFLWGTNGTAETTEVLAQLSTDGTRCTQSTLVLTFAPVVVGNATYFTWGGALWRSDGTKAGTRTLTPAAEPAALYALADRVLLLIDQAGTWALWQYLPVADQFEKLATVASAGPPFFRGHVQLGAVHHFSLGVAGRWQTDLTPAGTVPAGPMVDLIQEGVAQGTRVVVRGNGPQGSGIYVADGTDAGLLRVAADENDGGWVTVHAALRAIGPRVVFVKSDGRFGTTLVDRAELFALDPGQTVPVSLNPNPSETFTGWIAERDGGAWYAARRDGGEALYFTAGTGASSRVTALPHDTIAGAQLGSRFLIQNIATFTYPGRTFDVWITDGADGGPERLLNTGSPGAFALTDAGVALWEGTSLFRTDFTWQGTTPYRTLWSTPPFDAVAMSRRPYTCLVVTERLVPSLWCTDGTASGTAQVAALNDDSRLIKAGADRVVVRERDALVVTDGTPAGTRRYDLASSAAVSSVMAIDSQHAWVAAAGGSFVLDLATGTTTPFAQFVPLTAPSALLGDGRLAVIDHVDAVKVLDAAGAVSPLAGTFGDASGLESDGTNAWMLERAPVDGGTAPIWSISGTPVRVGSARYPWQLKAHRGALYVVEGLPETQPTEVVVRRLSPTRPTHEVLRIPFVPAAYNFSIAPVGGIVALHTGTGLMLHDPSTNRTWSPFPALGPVQLPRFVATDAGFPFVTTDGGVLVYDLTRALVVRPDGDVPVEPQGLAGVGPRTVLWARDPLGWAPWNTTP